jgi:hypothetical protein
MDALIPGTFSAENPSFRFDPVTLEGGPGSHNPSQLPDTMSSTMPICALRRGLPNLGSMGLPRQSGRLVPCGGFTRALDGHPG